MKRTSYLQSAPHEHQKRRKKSLASDQSSSESPMSDAVDQATVGSSDIRQISSLTGPRIIVHEAEGIEGSFGITEETPEPATTNKILEKVQESPSSRQESPKPLGAPHHPQIPVERSFIPDTIAYNLRFTFEFECPDPNHEEEELSVRLHRPESYKEIEKVADKRAQILSADSIGPKELKFFYGNCTIVRDNGTKFRLPLRSPEDWAKVNNHIVGYWNSHIHERLHLCISRHYLASQEHPIEGTPFAEVKCLEIHDLMKQTWEEKDYIPHNVLETVISDQTIHWIIKENPPESVPHDDQDAFIRRVRAEGRILLAMCVHAELKMECLKKLLDSGWKDSTLPLDENVQCHRECRHKIRRLLQAQGGFRAERFVGCENRKLHSHAVVPLHFCPRVRGRDDLDGEVIWMYDDEWQTSPSQEKTISTEELRRGALCGTGAYSRVYCVKLNPNHHSLTEDLDACFALKEFNIKQKNFDVELAMLKEIRKFAHAHIVTHLAAWTRDERYYILFPLAQCNLREYMEQNKFAENNVFWLLDQFRGMAEAVKRIHDLSYTEAQTTSLTVNTSAPEERRTAWHHDIKPENILYFKNSSSNYRIFRISDWGCGKVNTYRTRSYNTMSAIGTITYAPPEGKTSRPYDIWSLGCVFLEILVWAVFGSKAVESLSDQRDDRRNANSGTNSMTDDAYWHKNGRDFVLRPPVVTQLQDLDEALMQPDAPPFKEIVGYIKRMLEPEAHKRIKALELCDLFSRTTLTKAIQVKSRKDESDDVTRFSLIPTNDNPSEALFHELSPPGGPAYAERIDLSPSDISPRASRHSRNSSASDLMPAHATRSRQSSNASNRSYLSIREMKDSHSSANAPRAP